MFRTIREGASHDECCALIWNQKFASRKGCSVLLVFVEESSTTQPRRTELAGKIWRHQCPKFFNILGMSDLIENLVSNLRLMRLNCIFNVNDLWVVGLFTIYISSKPFRKAVDTGRFYRWFQIARAMIVTNACPIWPATQVFQPLNGRYLNNYQTLLANANRVY